MSEEMHGLAVDLTTVLEKRNRDCASARALIGGLITCVILGDKSSKAHEAELVKKGREWLAAYNDRVYKTEAEREK